MSLPPTKKDVSVHPAKASVADPVNPAVLNQDVDRKVSFLPLVYFIFERFLVTRLCYMAL